MDGPLCIVNSGEAAKSWTSLSSILEFLLKHHADQQSVLVVVGGGALSDVGGLAASLFKRGIRWVSVPTTLLAMVDAAWGGKTAINFGGVKNSVGVYHWPVHWIYDQAMLQSLNERQRFDGWAEILKHAIIGDSDLFQEIQAFWSSQHEKGQVPIGLLPLPTQDLIECALQVKIRIVQQDPNERNLRCLLNYGHTLAHALESSSPHYSHGQAVWLGMLFELQLASHSNLIAEDEALRILEILRAFAPYSGLLRHSTELIDIPTNDTPKGMGAIQTLSPMTGLFTNLPDWKTIWNFMLQDKKTRSGKLTWALPAKVGLGQTGVQIPNDKVMDLYKIWSSNPLI